MNPLARAKWPNSSDTTMGSPRFIWEFRNDVRDSLLRDEMTLRRNRYRNRLILSPFLSMFVPSGSITRLPKHLPHQYCSGRASYRPNFSLSELIMVHNSLRKRKMSASSLSSKKVQCFKNFESISSKWPVCSSNQSPSPLESAVPASSVYPLVTSQKPSTL